MNKPCVGVYLSSGAYIGFSISPDDIAQWKDTLSKAVRGNKCGVRDEVSLHDIIQAGELLEFAACEVIAWRICESEESTTTKLLRENVELMKKAINDGDEWKGGGA